MKSEISFDALTGGDCGGYLAEGKEFLVFTNDRGEISDCTSANIEKNERFRADLEVLRLFRDGKLESLSEPWVFTRGGLTCQLTHDFAFGGGSLWFVYRHEDAESPFFGDKQYRGNRTTGIGEGMPDAKPHPANYAGFLSLRAWFPHSGHIVEGSGRVIVEENSWHTRSADLEANFGPFEEIEGGRAREVLGESLSHSSVRLEAEFTDLPEHVRARYDNYPVYESGSPEYFAGNAIQRFQDCMESGAR